MEEKDHISELFKEAFDQYEVPVKPELWQQVSAKIQATSPAPAPDGTSPAQLATAAGKVTGSIGSWIAGAAIVVSVATGYYFYETRTGSESAGTAPVEQTGVNNVPLNEAAPVGENEMTEDETVSNTERPVSPAISNATNTSEEVASRKISAQETGNMTAPAEPEATHPVTRPASTTTLESASPTPSGASAQQAPGGNAVTRPDPSSSPSVKLRITASTLSGKAPLGISFSVPESQGQAEWNFGDGTEVYKGSRANHLFREPGTYMVTVKNTDEQGKTYTDMVRVEVLSDLSVSGVPNIFTPNGDGANDLFQVPAAGDIDIEVSIFDRSGKFIHRFTGADGGWNGKINNREDASEGTYFYVIFATGPNGEKNTQKGTITLKR